MHNSSKKIKIAIIGAGFSGLATAWHLLHHTNFNGKLDLHVYDHREIGTGTSGIAAGLLHPFAGAHAKLNHRGFEAVEETKKLLKSASDAIGINVSAHNNGIIRLALTENQKYDFMKCNTLYPQCTEWMSDTTCQELVPGCAQAPGLWIKEGITVYSALYLQGLWKACAAKGAHFIQKKIVDLQELQAFDQVVIAAGYDAIHFRDIGINLNGVKGQVLEFEWPKHLAPLLYTINSQAYILMSQHNQSCLVGASFEKKYPDQKIDIKTAINEILPKAVALYPPLENAKIIGCQAGMRGVSSNHLPAIKQLSNREWALIGMGSKGLLYHALYAKELVDMICLHLH